MPHTVLGTGAGRVFHERQVPVDSSLASRETPMENAGRLFLCHCCRIQVVVCSRCDRGQIYCAGDCAEMARKASLREAGQRYQKSRRGRFKHAERTRRYRLRQQKVTHRGSMPPAQSDLLAANSAVGREAATAGSTATSQTVCCHFCGTRHSGLLRQDFLHRYRVPSAVPSDRRGTLFDYLP